MTPAFPYEGALIQGLTDGVAPGFGHPIESSFASCRRSCALRAQNLPPTSTKFRDTPPFPPAPSLYPSLPTFLPAYP